MVPCVSVCVRVCPCVSVCVRVCVCVCVCVAFLFLVRSCNFFLFGIYSFARGPPIQEFDDFIRCSAKMVGFVQKHKVNKTPTGYFHCVHIKIIFGIAFGPKEDANQLLEATAMSLLQELVESPWVWCVTCELREKPFQIRIWVPHFFTRKNIRFACYSHLIPIKEL